MAKYKHIYIRITHANTANMYLSIAMRCPKRLQIKANICDKHGDLDPTKQTQYVNDNGSLFLHQIPSIHKTWHVCSLQRILQLNNYIILLRITSIKMEMMYPFLAYIPT